MSEQATWVPLPKRRIKAAKLPSALKGADRLIDWYLGNKPDVRRLAVSVSDYKAFEEHVGHDGILLTKTGIKYRGFEIYVAKG